MSDASRVVDQILGEASVDNLEGVDRKLVEALHLAGAGLEALWEALPDSDGGNRNSLQEMWVLLRNLAGSHQMAITSDVLDNVLKYS